MKSNQLFLLFFLIAFSIYGQGDERDGRDGSHVFKYPITLTECDRMGNEILQRDPLVETMEMGWKFAITLVTTKDFVIHIYKFPKKRSGYEIQNKKTFRTEHGTSIFYKISKEQYEDSAERAIATKAFVVGASTSLLKIRFGNGKDGDDAIYSEFGNDFNLGITAGVRLSGFKMKDFSLSLVGGIGYTAIKVTPQTTNNFILTESTQSSITLNGGFIVEIEKFQFSLFMGIDTMSGEIGRNWIHRNRPWLGIGFGYEIFKPKEKEKNS
ncbi:MAG: hypothetical protein COB81_05160 [Flavobacteriaceae bacterium]|nr:MAG: hypothetical protein COB81_05160 [Flavobacteriaceae bacterium]